MPVTRRGERWLIAAAVAILLADGSIVTLALPQLLNEFHASVAGVAAVLGIYCAVVAVALPVASRVRRATAGWMLGAGGLMLFGAASLGCAAAGSLAALLICRAVQGLGAAAALVVAFEVLHGSARKGQRLWIAAAVFGTAAGPALGGALTQAFDWRAIFLAGAPVAFGAACALIRLPPILPSNGGLEADASTHGAPTIQRGLAAVALALTAAALSAVLFLLVLLLVLGWGLSPLAAAGLLTLLPASAAGAARVGGAAQDRAALGCLLLGGGVLALAFVPRPSPWWLLAPELLAGCGIGLALPALAGELLPERTAAQAGRLLALRHAGIALTLVALAPLITAQLAHAEQHGRLLGVAALLDSPLDPGQKLALAPSLASALNNDNPHASIDRLVASKGRQLSPADRASLHALGQQGNAIIFATASHGLRDALLITGALAVLAAGITCPPRRIKPAGALAATVLALPIGYTIAHTQLQPTVPQLTPPCEPGRLPPSTGVGGVLQNLTLTGLDQVACERGITREELVLQLTRHG